MLERQSEGIAKAKAQFRYMEPAPIVRSKSQEVLAMKPGGKGATATFKPLGIGRASVYRIINEV